MERAFIVRGRLAGPRRIELDEPVDEGDGEVEVVVRHVEARSSGAEDNIFAFIRSLSAGTRTKSDIDQQIADERAWGGD